MANSVDSNKTQTQTQAKTQRQIQATCQCDKASIRHRYPGRGEQEASSGMGATVSDSGIRDQVADSKEAKKTGAGLEVLSGRDVPLFRASAPAHRRIRESPLSNEAIFRQVRLDEFLFLKFMYVNQHSVRIVGARSLVCL
jgi:hypothetical protein